jgi:proline dehydrogenase
MATGAEKVLRTLTYPLARRAARAYIVGDQLVDATAVCQRLERQGMGATIGFWNRDGEPPGEVFEQCSRIISEAARLTGRPYVSIKAPALGLRSDLIEQIGQKAAQHGVRVHFDSHGPDVADATLALVKAAQGVQPQVGCTLPGRWARSEGDARWAAEAGVYVRVVKGQWNESGDAAREPRAGFMAVIERLAGRARHVAVATHDPWLAARALERLQAARTPCELELLYGLPTRDVVAIAHRLGVAVRVYTPYGEAFLPYAIRYARQNPRIMWWLLKDACRLRGTSPSS